VALPVLPLQLPSVGTCPALSEPMASYPLSAAPAPARFQWHCHLPLLLLASHCEAPGASTSLFGSFTPAHSSLHSAFTKSPVNPGDGTEAHSNKAAAHAARQAHANKAYGVSKRGLGHWDSSNSQDAKLLQP
jgi:hypothetical protein